MQPLESHGSSLSMQTAQSYVYGEARYASPSQHSYVPNASSLPPIHAQNMQAQPHFAAVPLNSGAPMHPPPSSYNSNPTQFQYQNGLMPSNVALPMRYPLPPPPIPPNQLAGARDKREVRRRTKTGCLTCRKRRVKCDEGHPTCRNCLKSKRECLGYDPIFKQQTGHAPIQPAPTNPTNANSKTTTSSSTSATSHQPQTYPGTGGIFVPAPNPSQNSNGVLEYAPSLDPALANGTQSLTMAANSFSTTLHPTRKAKTITMEELFSLNDVPPRYQLSDAPPPNVTMQQQEIDDFYRFHFAQGLDKLFETTWYSSRGLAHLKQDPTLLDFVRQCVEQFRNPDTSAVQSLQSLEARLVWQLAIMPRTAHLTDSTNAPASGQLIQDALPRIDIVERLLTGQYLSQDRIPPSPSAADRNDATKYNERNFWHQLGSFTSHRDDNSDPQVTQAINENLNTMRGILGIMENRDVLYSLAIARYIGGRMDEFHPDRPLVASSNDANDEVNKLEVARRHVHVEDQKGTTQVIQRICGMAIRSWILQKR